MANMVWIGTAISLLGLMGILYSAVLMMRARGQDLTEDEMKQRLKRFVPVNLAALLLSMLGLSCVVVGLFFT